MVAESESRMQAMRDWFSEGSSYIRTNLLWFTLLHDGSDLRPAGCVDGPLSSCMWDPFVYSPVKFIVQLTGLKVKRWNWGTLGKEKGILQ